jgi:hypothetical protein
MPLALSLKFVGSESEMIFPPLCKCNKHREVLRVELCAIPFTRELDSLLSWNYKGAKTSRAEMKSRHRVTIQTFYVTADLKVGKFREMARCYVSTW